MTVHALSPARGAVRAARVCVIALFLSGCGTQNTPAPAPAPAAVAPSASGDQSGLVGVRQVPRVTTPPGISTTTQEPSPFRFADVAKPAGVDFVHVSGMTKDRHFPTANGSGVAIFDYDGDGKMDIYFASCNLLPLGSSQTGRNRLFKNFGNDKFQDVTDAAGLGFRGFCHGIVVGDIDNDGDQDVFLCNYGPNVLYLNNGNGTFQDVSKAAGVDQTNWSSGGAFLDYDNDGKLDLYVTNYGEWLLPRDDRFCGDQKRGIRQYCSPKEVKTVKHLLYHNDGTRDGVPHFTNVYDQVFYKRDGKNLKQVPGRSDGHGFGVLAADLDDDGLIDLYVANDQNPAFLFLNRGDGTFLDATEDSGAAYDEKGNAQSGMGVDAEDIDGDGLPELFRTNFKDEYNTLYQNLGKGNFYDQTPAFGLAADAMPWVGWGCSLADFDNDGWPDAFVTNGHVDDNYSALGQEIPYEEPPLLHRNVALGKGGDSSRRFRIATRDAGPYFASSHVGRGAAFGDLNDDGRIDIVVNHKDNTPAVLLNQTPGDNKWIRLRLRGTRSNRDGIGAKILVEAGQTMIHRQRKGGCSLESAHDPRVLIGVGPVDKVKKVTIVWPRTKAKSVLENIETGKTYDVVEPETDVPGGQVAAGSGK